MIGAYKGQEDKTAICREVVKLATQDGFVIHDDGSRGDSSSVVFSDPKSPTKDGQPYCVCFSISGLESLENLDRLYELVRSRYRNAVSALRTAESRTAA